MEVGTACFAELSVQLELMMTTHTGRLIQQESEGPLQPHKQTLYKYNVYIIIYREHKLLSPIFKLSNND